LSVAYLDSSALAKLYLDEDPTEQQQVIDLVERCGQVASCAIAYAEVSGVFARYFHEGKLTQGDYDEKLARFSADWETVSAVSIAPELSALAAQLMKSQRGLRAMDALHLASALRVRAEGDLQFLTFDNHLRHSAQAVMPEAVA
jgi:uncharacterized protein